MTLKKIRIILKPVELQAFCSSVHTATSTLKAIISDVLEQTCLNDQASIQIVAFTVVSSQHCE